MRIALTLLLLASLLAPTPVHADDASKTRIRQLEEKIARLQKQIEELKATVRQLEAENKALRGQTATPTPDVPATGPVGSVVGTYELDEEALEEALIDMTIKKVRESKPELDGVSDEAMRPLVKEMAAKQLKGMRLVMRFAADKTFRITGKIANTVLDGSGTWTQKGARVEILNTYKDGRRLRVAEKTVCKLEGKRLKLDRDDLPFTLVMRRK